MAANAVASSVMATVPKAFGAETRTRDVFLDTSIRRMP
jgi:hypothetical protein